MNEDFIIEEGRLLGYIGNAKELIIPEGIKSIELGAFWIFKIKRKTVCGNVDFEKIYIPQSVEKIMVSADNLFMDYWQKLIEIKVSDDNRIYKSIDGNLYTKDGKKLIRYATQKKETVFVVPEGVSVIGEGAFACCENLTRITLPDSLTVIEKRGFEGCGNLAEIVMLTNPDKGIEIKGEVFSGCKSLISLEFASGTISIGDSVFRGCSQLKKVIVPKTVVYMANQAFNLDDWDFEAERSQLTICCEAKRCPKEWDMQWNPTQHFVLWDYKRRENVEYVIRDDMLYEIYGDMAVLKQVNENISNCVCVPSRIKKENNEKKLTTIGKDAFKNNYKLLWLSFSYDNNIENIESNAFENCKNLLFVEIPITVKYIGKSAFKGCKELKIYCEADSKPEDWADDWNPDNRPVVWGYKVW